QVADACRAPTFDCLAGKVAELLTGRVVAAHNLRFHAMFLRHEYRLIGVHVPVHSDVGLCTMALAAQYIPVTSRSLRDCCVAAGVRLGVWHSALGNARAAAGLLATYLSVAPEPLPWAPLLVAVQQLPWPSLPGQEVNPVVRSTRHSPDEHVLSRLVNQLPRVRQPQADGYLAVLDRALISQRDAESGTDDLAGLAAEFGLDQAAAAELHDTYLRALAGTAVDDCDAPGAERRDLERMARLLGMGPDAVDAALAGVSSPDMPSPEGETDAIRYGDMVLAAGHTDRPSGHSP
ncbi:MAG TPA: hypothetical protein VHJ83_11985, partial [Micromonosporaceae bacterium]|nr:hypothetical protein [Micromonosporaceae bacterium]